MRVLLDDGIDEMLGDALTGHKCTTAVDMDLGGLPIEALREKIGESQEAWDAFITFHHGPQGKRVMPELLTLAIDAAPSSDDDQGTYMPQVAIALETMQPGEMALIGKDWLRKLEG